MNNPSYVIEQWQNKARLTHRIGGPAIVYSDGTRRWFLWGIEFPIENYIEELVRLGYKEAAESILWQI